MRKHWGTPSWRDKYVTLAAISPPSVARGRFVGGHQTGLAGCKLPPLFKRGASSCSQQQQGQREPLGASSRRSAPTYLPTSQRRKALCHFATDPGLWMQSILLNIAILDPDANLPVLHPAPCFKHLSRGPLFHTFLSQPQQSCPAQPAPVLPPDEGKTGGVLVLVLGCAPQAQGFV